MIERKFLPLVVAVFVLTAGISGSATVAVLSDSETVKVQISPGNVTATVVDNATAPAEENQTATETQNATEEVTIDEVDGFVVALDPGDRTIDASGQAEYDVYVKGATEGIVSYDMSLELSDSSVASFESFTHHDYSASSNQTIADGGGRIDASAGFGSEIITNMSESDKVVLGTVTVTGVGAGTTSLDFVNESGHILTVTRATSDTDGPYYEVGAMEGGELTVTSANEPPTATNDTYSVSKVDALQHPASVLDNDDDPDGDELTTSLVSGPSNGELEFFANGSFVYTPASNFTGQTAFTYEARDDNGGVDSAMVTIQVETPGNGSQSNGSPGNGPPG